MSPGVKRFKTARASSRAAWMRSRVSFVEVEVIQSPLISSQFPVKAPRVSPRILRTRVHTDNWELRTDFLRPQHSCARHQEHRAQNSTQPEHRDARGQVRPEDAAGDGADQYCDN